MKKELTWKQRQGEVNNLAFDQLALQSFLERCAFSAL